MLTRSLGKAIFWMIDTDGKNLGVVWHSVRVDIDTTLSVV